MKKSLWLACGMFLVAAMLGSVLALRAIFRPASSPYVGNASLARLQALPETNLFYPDSEIVVRLEWQDGGLFASRNPSYAGYDLAVNAGDDVLLAFYTRELQGRDWQALGELYSTRSTAERIARSWRKGDKIFRFAIRKKDDPQGPPTDIAAHYSAVYTIQIRNLNSDGR